EFRTQIARRGLHFGFSQLPGGDQIGVNIPGYAYFGREPYSTVDRIERRFEFTDNVTLVRAGHIFKMGGDYNLIQLRSKKAQIFELDFGGDVNFGGLAASHFGFPDNVPGVTALPGTTALQSYGLGIPTSYIQGIGNSNHPFDNQPMGFFLPCSCCPQEARLLLVASFRKHRFAETGWTLPPTSMVLPFSRAF